MSVGVCAVALLFALAGPLDAGIRTPVRLQELTMALALTFALALALLLIASPGRIAHLFARELCGVSTGFSSANAAGGAVFGMGRGSQEARAEGSTRHAI